MRLPQFSCTTEIEFKQHAEKFARSVGFASFGFAAQQRKPEAGRPAGLLIVENVGSAWLESIRSAVDTGRPHNLVRHASLQMPPFGWNTNGELSGHTIVDPLAQEHVRRMRAWSALAGALCPVHAPELSWGALAFFSPKAMSVAELDRVLPVCALYAQNFCFWYMQALHRRTRVRGALLTRREIQCLDLASIGKTSAEIGAILVISARTVEGYIATACNKLDCRNRAAAITKARELHLLGNSDPLKASFERQRDEGSRKQARSENAPP